MVVPLYWKGELELLMSGPTG